jgi:hypothetical protein
MSGLQGSQGHALQDKVLCSPTSALEKKRMVSDAEESFLTDCDEFYSRVIRGPTAMPLKNYCRQIRSNVTARLSPKVDEPSRATAARLDALFSAPSPSVILRAREVHVASFALFVPRCTVSGCHCPRRAHHRRHVADRLAAESGHRRLKSCNCGPARKDQVNCRPDKLSRDAATKDASSHGASSRLHVPSLSG